MAVVYGSRSNTINLRCREAPAAHGDRQMPIWGDVFSAPSGTSQRTLRRRIEALVAFIEELQYR